MGYFTFLSFGTALPSLHSEMSCKSNAMQLSEESVLCKAPSFSKSMHQMSAGMRCREKCVCGHYPPLQLRAYSDLTNPHHHSEGVPDQGCNASRADCES